MKKDFSNPMIQKIIPVAAAMAIITILFFVLRMVVLPILKKIKRRMHRSMKECMRECCAMHGQILKEVLENSSKPRD
ncbi:MAG: hypothetical protein JW795_15345 [Chitinivibrionales bacterium]|nr:hypothetical protein [Chitinivibrionales bacterium]